MDNERLEDWEGHSVTLPDGQMVVIETVYGNGTVSVRRVGGDLDGTTYVCSLDSLRSKDKN